MISNINYSILMICFQVLQQVDVSCQLKVHIHAEVWLIGQQEIKKGLFWSLHLQTAQ